VQVWLTIKQPAQVFASPRRLVARVVWLLSSTQPDRAVEKQGPFVAQAFGSGWKTYASRSRVSQK
jgi:glycyl-tRNA synthetase beta subunit